MARALWRIPAYIHLHTIIIREQSSQCHNQWRSIHQKTILSSLGLSVIFRFGAGVRFGLACTADSISKVGASKKSLKPQRTTGKLKTTVLNWMNLQNLSSWQERSKNCSVFMQSAACQTCHNFNELNYARPNLSTEMRRPRDAIWWSPSSPVFSSWDVPKASRSNYID